MWSHMLKHNQEYIIWRQTSVKSNFLWWIKVLLRWSCITRLQKHVSKFFCLRLSVWVAFGNRRQVRLRWPVKRYHFMDLSFINMCCTARRLADVCSRSAFKTFTVKINALDNSSILIKLLSFLRDFSFLLFNDTFSAFLHSVSSSFRIRRFYLFLFVGFFCIPSSLGSKLEPSQCCGDPRQEQPFPIQSGGRRLVRCREYSLCSCRRDWWPKSTAFSSLLSALRALPLD